jgi:hypothetical protein
MKKLICKSGKDFLEKFFKGKKGDRLKAPVKVGKG